MRAPTKTYVETYSIKYEQDLLDFWREGGGEWTFNIPPIPASATFIVNAILLITYLG